MLWATTLPFAMFGPCFTHTSLSTLIISLTIYITWGIYPVDAYIILYVSGCLHHLTTLPFEFPFTPSVVEYHVIYLMGLFVAYASRGWITFYYVMSLLYDIHLWETYFSCLATPSALTIYILAHILLDIFMPSAMSYWVITSLSLRMFTMSCYYMVFYTSPPTLSWHNLIRYILCWPLYPSWPSFTWDEAWMVYVGSLWPTSSSFEHIHILFYGSRTPSHMSWCLEDLRGHYGILYEEIMALTSVASHFDPRYFFWRISWSILHHSGSLWIILLIFTHDYYIICWHYPPGFIEVYEFSPIILFVKGETTCICSWYLYLSMVLAPSIHPWYSSIVLRGLSHYKN